MSVHGRSILSLDYLANHIFQVKFKGLVSNTTAVSRRRGSEPGLPPLRTHLLSLARIRTQANVQI